MTVELARPELLYLLLLLPLWLFVIWPRGRSAPRFSRPHDDSGSLPLTPLRAVIVLAAPRILRTLAVIVLLLALASPERVRTVHDRTVEGMGIALAVDLSTSMLAEDMGEGNRLEIAREAAVRFAERRDADEITLIAFAGQAFTRVPPTTDRDVIIHGVRSLQIDLVRNGTDLAGAILTAVARLGDTALEPKVIVLLTDGAHNAAGAEPLGSARVAAARGIRIHPIGLSPEAVENRNTGVGAARPRETVLSVIASMTGGQYFQASSAADLDSIYRRIDQLEAPRPRALQSQEREPLSPWLMVFALSLIGLEALVRGSRWGVIP